MTHFSIKDLIAEFFKPRDSIEILVVFTATEIVHRPAANCQLTVHVTNEPATRYETQIRYQYLTWLYTMEVV